MTRWHIFLTYFFVVTILFFVGLTAHLSKRYINLEGQVRNIEMQQWEWIEENKRLIAVIAKYSSAVEIEKKAVAHGLVKVPPENVLQIYVKN
ncbi:MAG: cell division protein FtsL [Treponema sp.]|jgi:cell division protein FtsL|nr:cell division protein FtsL [Treponema sp.]